MLNLLSGVVTDEKRFFPDRIAFVSLKKESKTIEAKLKSSLRGTSF
jgi:hypothetical protein